MNNKKTFLTIALIVIMTLVLIKVFSPRNKVAENQIKIGVAIPLTGNYASIGEKIKNGLDMAKQDIESGNLSLSIDLIYEDACLPKDVTSAVQKLISLDKVKVINQFCAVGLVPSLEITEPNKIISVGIGANVDDLLGKNYYFSPNFSVKDNAKAIADFATSTLKAKRVAFIYYNTQFGKDYRKYIGQSITEFGGKIVGDEMTTLEASDFRTNLIKIKDAKPDVIFVTQLAGALGTIIKQARDLGIEAPLIGNYQNEDPTVLSVAGSAAEGFIISSADPTILSKDTSGFKERFQDKYGIAPDVFASNAYDALNLEISAYIECSGEVECIKDELHEVSDYKGVSGSITIDQNGIASKPTIFKIVKDGQFVKFEQ